MTVLHVMTVPMSLGFLRGQAAFMRAHGVQLMAATSPGAGVAEFSDAEGVPVFTVPMLREITPLRDLVALWRLYRLVRRMAPDVVHAHTPKAGLLGMLAARLAGVPARIYHLRGLPHETATGLRRALLRRTEMLSCRLAHRVFCVSDSLRAAAVRDGICPPARLRVPGAGSGNGVDAVHRFRPDPATRLEARRALGLSEAAVVLGFVGRLVRDKGVLELHRAWRQLRAEEEPADVHLLVVGPAEARDGVPAHVLRELREDPRVQLVGSRTDVAALYAAMDVLVLPTYREGFPNVALEAAAMALPVVATRATGCVDAVVEGVTGTLVPTGDADALAAALRRYIDSPELRRLHGRAARERVLQEFRPERIWRELLDEYVAAAAAGGRTLNASVSA